MEVNEREAAIAEIMQRKGFSREEVLDKAGRCQSILRLPALDDGLDFLLASCRTKGVVEAAPSGTTLQ